MIEAQQWVQNSAYSICKVMEVAKKLISHLHFVSLSIRLKNKRNDKVALLYNYNFTFGIFQP